MPTFFADCWWAHLKRLNYVAGVDGARILSAVFTTKMEQPASMRWTRIMRARIERNKTYEYIYISFLRSLARSRFVSLSYKRWMDGLRYSLEMTFAVSFKWDDLVSNRVTSLINDPNLRWNESRILSTTNLRLWTNTCRWLNGSSLTLLPFLSLL